MRYTPSPLEQVATPAPSPKGKAPPTTEAVSTAGAPNAPVKEWIPIQPVASATANNPGKNNTDSKGKHSWLPESSNGGEGAPIRDAESGALVWCSPGGNGSVVVVYEDGLTVTTHADGTVQRWRRGEDGGHSVDWGLVLVECPGFASIEVSLLGECVVRTVFLPVGRMTIASLHHVTRQFSRN